MVLPVPPLPPRATVNPNDLSFLSSFAQVEPEARTDAPDGIVQADENGCETSQFQSHHAFAQHEGKKVKELKSRGEEAQDDAPAENTRPKPTSPYGDHENPPPKSAP